MANLGVRALFSDNTPEVALKSLFCKYDEDKSGQLSQSELAVLFKEDLGFDDQQSEAYALLLDKDGNGEVSFHEFTSWLKSGEKLQNITDKSRYNLLVKAVDFFNRYDKDRSQALDPEEFKKLFLEMGGQEVHLEGALKEMDKDKNGIVSFPEFLRWLNWIPLEDF
ncbi:calmodulin-like protein [Clytia hemisphaerica]|uniref:EF-hand domain-containing protein n=1 Tax=Clytia hemisphaerica TaxID=252671 RepID=A0A7M5WKH1_9CNID|eukprot:TCONS_00062517-protein